MKNYKNQLGIPKIILSYLTDTVFGFLRPKREVPFPQKIGPYTFKKKISFRRSNTRPFIFTFALYENAKKEKAIAKMWNGKIKNFTYYTLCNEILMNQILNQVIKRLDTSLPKKFQGITIPNFLGTFKSKDSLVLLTEFINGNPASTFSEGKSFDIYLKVSDFLRYLGTQLTNSEKARITYRKPVDLALLYPLLLAKVSFTHPRFFSSFLKGTPIFLFALIKLFRKSSMGLGHGDLSLNNILISPQKIALIDLQLCVFSAVQYDFLTTLCIYWDNGKIRKKLITEIAKRYGKEENSDILIKGLMVNIATHALTGNSYSRKEIDKFIDYLNFAIGKKTIRDTSEIFLTN